MASKLQPVGIILAAAGIATVGTWAKHKTLNPKIVVGGAVLALVFAFVEDAQPNIARDFAWLILASTAGAYGSDLFGSIGEVTSGAKKVATGSEIGSGGGTPMRAE